MHFPSSHYTLRHFEGTKTVWTPVGDNATDALAAVNREQHVRQAKNMAAKAGVIIVEKEHARLTLLALKKKWLLKLDRGTPSAQ